MKTTGLPSEPHKAMTLEVSTRDTQSGNGTLKIGQRSWTWKRTHSEDMVTRAVRDKWLRPEERTIIAVLSKLSEGSSRVHVRKDVI